MNIVIFGATSAIAQSFARLYAPAGGRFFLVARNAERLATIAADLGARGAERVESATADLADLTVHAGLIAQAKSALGAIDRVLIAHGTLSNQQTCETDTESMIREIGINRIHRRYRICRR